jgi:hypothetical protein
LAADCKPDAGRRLGAGQPRRRLISFFGCSFSFLLTLSTPELMLFAVGSAMGEVATDSERVNVRFQFLDDSGGDGNGSMERTVYYFVPGGTVDYQYFSTLTRD